MISESGIAYEYRYAVLMFRVNPGDVKLDAGDAYWMGWWI